MGNYFFLKDNVTSEEAVSHFGLNYEQLSIAHYQVNFYANNYFEELFKCPAVDFTELFLT